MNALTEALYDRMAGDGDLVALLSSYQGEPAVFTARPAPGAARLPYIVADTLVSDAPRDTKQTRGRDIRRDINYYAEATGESSEVDAIAERVRALFHRQSLEVEGFGVWMTECGGPVSADESDAYRRIVTVRIVMTEE